MTDLNVADSGARRPLPLLLRFAVAVTAVSLSIVACVALTTFGVRAVRSVASDPSADVDSGPAVAEVEQRAAESASRVDARRATAEERLRSTDADDDHLHTELPAVTATRDSQTASTESGPGAGATGTGATGTSAAIGAPTLGPLVVAPTGEGGAIVARATRVSAVVMATAPAVAEARPTSMPLVRGGAPVWRAPRLSEPPTLDGELDEWSGEPVAIESVVFGSEFWDGPDDLSATAFGGWDDDALFIAVQVVDEYFSQPSGGRELHLSDSLELQIDADLSGDLKSGAYTDDDWQIGVAPGDFEDNAPSAYVWRPLAGATNEVRSAAQRLDNGYIVEFAVPWAMIGFDPAESRSLGVALNVSDNDDPRPAQLTMISLAPSRSWADPRTFATLVLVD